jgi:hypothetical protein
MNADEGGGRSSWECKWKRSVQLSKLRPQFRAFKDEEEKAIGSVVAVSRRPPRRD